MMPACGLLGRKLGHSYSPAIHAMFGPYEYRLYEKEPEELERFLREGGWDGLNVTIPYKKAVVPFCDELGDTAAATGSVNTLVRRADGTIFGDSTDASGFAYMVRLSGIDVAGEKVLVLGSGGASAAVCHALKELRARPVVISRSGPDHYGNLDRHRDAAVIVNATPVGMYPDNGRSPLSLDGFSSLRGVLDIVYNPARTALLLDAEERGLASAGGLSMLTAQAARSSELFTGIPVTDETVARVTDRLEKQTANVILVGMPGCGKTTVAEILARRTGREVLDSDREIVADAGRSIPEIFAAEGESSFRDRETSVLCRLGSLSGRIIATGGGAVLREENYRPLHQNGVSFWLVRDLSELDREGRPLSQNADLAAMFAAREPRYRRFADHVIDNNGTPEETADRILEVIT